MNAGGQAFDGRFDAVTQRILPSSEVTHVHLLRHGAVQGMSQRIVRGQLDEPLSDEGRGETRALVRWLAEHEPRPARILSSDLVRCRELAVELARATGAPCTFEPRLREQSMGEWEGRTWSEITAAEPAAVSAYWADYFDARPSGGESLADVQARAWEWWSEVEDACRGERIAVVTHIGVLRVLLCRWLSIPGDQALRFAPATASHTALQLGAAGAVVNALGERPWRASSVVESAKSAASSPNTKCARRIAITGSAGTGKTTLGRALADELGVPFLAERMRERIESGLDVGALSRRDWRALIESEWESQCAAEAACPNGFVADRSSVDFAAFWLHYGLQDERELTERWMARMFAHARGYERLIVCPWGDLPLVDDGVRSTNRWTQLRYHSILEGLLARMAPGRVLLIADAEPIDARVEHVLAAVS